VPHLAAGRGQLWVCIIPQSSSPNSKCRSVCPLRSYQLMVCWSRQKQVFFTPGEAGKVWWEKELARTRSQQNEDYQSYDSRLAGLVGLRSIIPLRAAPFFLVRLFQLDISTLCTEVCVHSARGGGGI